MPARRIIELGDPLLRELSEEVVDLPYAARVLEDLADTLHEFQRTHGFGRGIAAIQIGEKARIVYIEIRGQRYELINPRYLFQSEEKFVLWDDCFSFPNLMVELERHKSVEIAYENRQGETCTLLAENDFSELVQHELDHLDGVVSIDRALDPKYSFMTRSEYLRHNP